MSIIKLIGTRNLKMHYSGQTDAQPCYVELDCETLEMRADYDGEIGNAVPQAEWHGLCIRWAIPWMRVKDADLLLRELRPLAEIVLGGFESVWDGSNLVGRYTDDAHAAIDRIEVEIENEVAWIEAYG